jgi:hypothetical protein
VRYSDQFSRAAVTAAALVGLSGTPAAAHGFAERYDLPVPLWLYLSGAGAAVGLSFVVVALFLRSRPRHGSYPRVNLLRWRPFQVLAHRRTVFIVRLLAVSLFLLAIVAGLFGNQSAYRNIIDTLVWVIWWVGLAYVSAFLGDLWALVNPIKTIFAWAETAYSRLRPGQSLSLNLPYPPWLGAWPGVVLLTFFLWIEVVWDGSAVPRPLALAMVAYAAFSWIGMWLYGREPWLWGGEIFSIFFGLIARLAPTELRVSDPAICTGCSAPQCKDGSSSCVNCADCAARAGFERREWNLRPPVVGLLVGGVPDRSLMVFVLLMLAMVTFDGFTETPTWGTFWAALLTTAEFRPVLQGLQSLAGNAFKVLVTFALVLFPLIFLATYLGVSRLMALAAGPAQEGDAGFSTWDLARNFVLCLIPIALAYHLAHYLSFLLVTGQLIIPLASDPFGYGWNLFGTADVKMNIGIVDARFVWFTAVVAIVMGHILAVYLAHVVAMEILVDRRRALRSQYPMLCLMIVYTVVSLWILAQPVVEYTPDL